MSAEMYTATRTRSFLIPINSRAHEYAGPSVIWARAQELIEEGADGLRLLEGRVATLSAASSSERTVFSRAIDLVSKKVRLNQAAIIAGVGLHTAENMLITGRFWEEEFVREYHQAVGTSPLALDLWAQIAGPVDLDPTANQALLKLAREDRLLSSFFAPRGLELAPEGFRRLIDESGVIDEVRLYILPAYLTKEPMAKAA